MLFIEHESPTIASVLKSLESMKIVLDALTDFVRGHCHEKLSFAQVPHPKYKVTEANINIMYQSCLLAIDAWNCLPLTLRTFVGLSSRE